MTRLSEKCDVQEALVTYLIGSGWDYLPPDDVLQARGNDLREPFLPPTARQRLTALNPGLVTPANVEDVLHRLRTVRPDMTGNENFLAALRGRWTVYDEAQKRERNFTLIDFDTLKNNTFTFTQEFKFEDRDVRRADMVLFVNGLPVAIVENKSPTLPEPELEAFDQVQHTYTQRIPELLKFPQLFAACDLRLHYGATLDNVSRCPHCPQPRRRRRGGYFFDCQVGTFSIVKVQAKRLKWVLFRLSNGYFFA